MGRRVRCLAVSLAATVVAGAVAAALVVSRPASGGEESGVVDASSLLLLLALGWGLLSVLAGVREAWRTPGPVVSPARPGAVRRLVLAACGVVVTGALVVPTAHAVPRSQTPPSTATALVTTTPPPPDRHVVVRRGDCLWSLAEQEVQPGAGPMTVTARWRALYAANRGVIGDDPDLIRPGQRLRMPR